MSILSDRTIRKLCLTPTKIFNQKAYDEFVAEKNRLGWGGSISVKNIPHILEMQRERLTRDATQEEIDAFVPMISPFHPELIRLVKDQPVLDAGMIRGYTDRKIISMGTTSYGYDVSLTDDVKIFTNTNALEIDPKRFDEKKCLVDAEIYTDEDGGRFVRIPPHSYMLGATREYFRIPRDIMVVCLGKSTYARSGVLVNTTPIEPGFEGNVVIEIANTTPLPARIYLGEGVAQFLFLRGDEPCETSYGDRGGKYQGQTGVTLPTV